MKYLLTVLGNMHYDLDAASYITIGEDTITASEESWVSFTSLPENITTSTNKVEILGTFMIIAGESSGVQKEIKGFFDMPKTVCSR